MTLLVGVDGCPDGWLAVAFDDAAGTGTASARVFPGFAEVLAGFSDALICVDMPIGLADGPEGRGCDAEIRAALGPRRSSVFQPPCRAALSAHDYPDANAIQRKVTGKGLSKQAWMIAPRIAEIDALLRPGDQDRVSETHPEFAFTVAAGAPMAYPKRSLHGHFARLRLLHRLGFDPSGLAAGLPPRTAARPDDLLDACILAHVAAKRGVGRATRVPARPRTDGRGLRMEIWG